MSRKLSVVFERTSILSYSRFQSNARQDEGVIFTHKSYNGEVANFFFGLFYILFRRKKDRSCLNLHSFTTDSKSFYENYKAINSFPNIPFVKSGR